MRIGRITTLITVAFFLATSGFGQFSQYTQPGTLTTGTEVTREGFESATDEASWRLGPVYAEPWFGVREVAYVENALGTAEGEEIADVTATAGAGVRTYLRTGPKVYWTAQALPEYVWWQDLDDRRRLNGRYGAGVFAFFNRLTLEAGGRRTETQEIASTELIQRINQRLDNVTLSAEVEVARSISVFGQFKSNRYRHLLNDEERDRVPIFGLFDRDEDALQAGLRFQLGQKLSVGIGVEESETTFLSSEQDQSNTATSPLIDLKYLGNSVQLQVDAAQRTLTPEPGSELQETDQLTGRIGLDLNRGGRLRGSIYASRLLNLSVSPDYSFYAGETLGASVSYQFSGRTQMRVYVEDGSLNFEETRPDVAPRSDSVSAFGGEFSYEVGRSLVLSLTYSSNDITSDVPGQDRSQRFFGIGFTFGGGPSGWY